MEVEWSRLKAREIAELARKDAIVVVPIGATEQHGPHLPVMVDARLAGEVALRAARIVVKKEPIVTLPSIWFGGKAVLDAGCGNGRWSYTLAKLGAAVTALDRSAAGLKEVERICGAFPGFRAIRHDLLEPLPTGAAFDFVWNFGVAHHTGWTQRALHNVCNAVRPGGILFTMIYGEPREGRPGEYAEINSYTEVRRATSGMSFDERIAYLRGRFKEEDVNGWFDAVSPKVNDLHRFDEVRDWLLAWGFEDIRRTFENRSLFITARRRQ